MGCFKIVEDGSSNVAEKHVQEGFNIRPGTVKFEVISAESTFSSTGNPMIAVRLLAKDSAGGQETIYDYLLQKHSWKIEAFLAAIGHKAWYTAGEFETDDCVGKTGECIIRVQAGTNGYKDKMVAAKYLPSEAQSSAKPLKVEAPRGSVKDMEDDLPF